jgi:hypothetical protein
MFGLPTDRAKIQESLATAKPDLDREIDNASGENCPAGAA